MALPHPAKEPDAYLAWVAIPNKSKRDTMKNLSQRLGMPHKTLLEWRSKYKWEERYLADVTAVAQHLSAVSIARSKAALTAAIDSIAEGASDPNERLRDRVLATRLLAELALPRGSVGGGDTYVIDKQLIIEAKVHSAKELAMEATKAIQANLDTSASARVSGMVKAMVTPKPIVLSHQSADSAHKVVG